MDPRRTIEELCRQYGVPAAFGQRLLPLVERAAQSPPEKRDRLLQMVIRSFAEEARRRTEDRETRVRRARFLRGLSPGERRMLKTVAAVLHHWSPPPWLEGWGERQS
ncbi:MAG: hypothetical protein AB1726_05630 [Planctomycetota bacterium]